MRHPSCGFVALALAGGLLLAGCSDQIGSLQVDVQGSPCGDDYGPALDAWVTSMDADNSGTVNSDEFNAAFQEADDDMDGKLDLDELRSAVCGNGGG